jgi:anti-sigma factor RsiW
MHPNCDSPDYYGSTTFAKFELISAYLDGEATPEECEQVRHWLATEPESQKLYQRLLKLHQSFHHLPSPAQPVAASQVADALFTKIDRARHQKLAWTGGAAIAAIFLGAISLVRPANLQMAEQARPTASVTSNQNPELLMIAVNRPVIELPDNEQQPSP